MEPRNEASPIKWGGVTKPIVPFDHTSNEDSRTVVGQVGHDKRQWTIAHSKALQDPMQVCTVEIIIYAISVHIVRA